MYIIRSFVEFNRTTPLFKYIVLQIVGILLAVCFPLSLSLSLVLLFSAAASLILQRDQWTFPIIVICLMMVRWVITQPAISHGAPTDTRISGVVEWIKPSASGNRLKLVSISDRRYTFIFTDRHKKSVLLRCGSVALPPGGAVKLFCWFSHFLHMTRCQCSALSYGFQLSIILFPSSHYAGIDYNK